MIRYERPHDWIDYDARAILAELCAAKSAVLALTEIPFQRSWADELQQIQLKREVAGTSRIEGAVFSERELDVAMRDSPERLETRSQRQASAAVRTYRWLAKLPADRPLDEDLVREIHRRMVEGCDDDHCPPGRLRQRDQNVIFGAPSHRGAEGGDEVAEAFRQLFLAARGPFQRHDPLVQALALHYHFAALHPFLDGNGRTARALEALMLQRIGLRDTLFIAMSNYYYEEKMGYLNALNETRANGHRLDAFLRFGLRGIESQCRRLFREIRLNVAKALYRNTMFDLFTRLKSPRKRVMSTRQLEILKLLLEADEIRLAELRERMLPIYHVANPVKALMRDLNYLIALDAICYRKLADSGDYLLLINLEWPATITETEFFRRTKGMPTAKAHRFLTS